MTDSEWTNRFRSTAEFFELAKARLSINTPGVLTDGVNDTFELPLAFLTVSQNHRREKADWNGLITSVYAISFNDRKILGV